MDKNKLSFELVKNAAATLGRKGGSVKSEKKTAAVRENGKKGGRPVTTGSRLNRERKAKK